MNKAQLLISTNLWFSLGGGATGHVNVKTPPSSLSYTLFTGILDQSTPLEPFKSFTNGLDHGDQEWAERGPSSPPILTSNVHSLLNSKWSRASSCSFSGYLLGSQPREFLPGPT